MATPETILPILQNFRGLEPLKQLFYVELNYNRANIPLDNLPESTVNLVAETPLVLATGGKRNDFHIIYTHLNTEKLRKTDERHIITHLQTHYPDTLYIFSNKAQDQWHFVNVKLTRETSENTEQRLKQRNLFRRITIAPDERLRTAAERIARLDLAAIAENDTLFNAREHLTPIDIRKAHEEAFNVEAVTEAFFEDYKRSFKRLQTELTRQHTDEKWAHDYTQQFLSRCLFLYFIQRKRWLGDDTEFLRTFYETYQAASQPADTFVERWLNVLFFEAFNNKFHGGYTYFPRALRETLQLAPYLNGGLFRENALDTAYAVRIPDALWQDIFTFFERYNFTIAEDTPLDQEVAVDPEMIGKVYESLVSAEDSERGDAGIFYTPRVEIDLMCRLALVDNLTNNIDVADRDALKHILYEVLFAFEETEKHEADARLGAHWQSVYEHLQNLTVLDPACGSGSFLVGMLHILDDLHARAEHYLNPSASPLEKGGSDSSTSPLEKGGKGGSASPLEKGGSAAPLEKGGKGGSASLVEKGGKGGFDFPLEKEDKGGADFSNSAPPAEPPSNSPPPAGGLGGVANNPSLAASASPLEKGGKGGSDSSTSCLEKSGKGGSASLVEKGGSDSSNSPLEKGGKGGSAFPLEEEDKGDSDFSNSAPPAEPPSNSPPPAGGLGGGNTTELDGVNTAELGEGTQNNTFDRRKSIIGKNLYGVDVKPWACKVAELRLWLALIIDAEFTTAELNVREEPLLPDFSFNIRHGDSIVQDIGGMNLAQTRTLGSGVPRALQQKITDLQTEKRKFYNGEAERKYAEKEEVEAAEHNLFREILQDYETRKSREIRVVEAWLEDPAEQLTLTGLGVSEPRQLSFETQQKQRELAKHKENLAQVQRARAALASNTTPPFVWDIAFVEIFQQRGGFDIIIENPPYVRQEQIADPTLPRPEVTTANKREYKAKLARAIYQAFPDHFGYKENRSTVKNKLDAKSDLYIYFYLHGLSLLNPQGTFCSITSNSWLDVGYGKHLQAFLLKRCHLKLVLDNAAKRSFKGVNINTIITLISAPNNIGEANRQHTTRFVNFTVPFEAILNPIIFYEIETATARLSRPEHRIHAVTQEALLTTGTDEKAKYAGDKWGAKYLRAPDIYWHLLENYHDKLIRVGEVADTPRGFTTGANSFFVLDSQTISTWNIEAEFLSPVINNPRDVKSLFVHTKHLPNQLFMCRKRKKDLRNTSALAYIEWGESQRFHERQTCRTRQPWYALRDKPRPRLTFPQLVGSTAKITYAPDGCWTIDNFTEIHPPSDLSIPLCFALNSTLFQLMLNLSGCANRGYGFLKMQTSDLSNLLCPDLKLLNINGGGNS